MTADRVRARRVAHVLQITDCHLFPHPGSTLLGVNTCASLVAVLRQACGEREPDALVATGDIAQVGTTATYRLFLDTVRAHFDGPLLCVPGNHDHGATLAAALPVQDLEVGSWRVLGVDTHVDDVVGGEVGGQELARLSNALATPHGRPGASHPSGTGAAGRATSTSRGPTADGRHGPSMPTLVVGHHCPVELGCAWLDVHRIADGDAMVALMDRAGVEVYAFGHIHQEAVVDSPTRLLGTPSTCFQFAPGTPAFAIDVAKPGYRWLHLAEDGTFASEVRRIEDFPLTINLRDRGHR